MATQMSVHDFVALCRGNRHFSSARSAGSDLPSPAGVNPVRSDMPELVAASLGGRGASSQELGAGNRNHAVPGAFLQLTGNTRHGRGPALCGVRPGPRSMGWQGRDGDRVTCPKCLNKMARI